MAGGGQLALASRAKSMNYASALAAAKAGTLTPDQLVSWFDADWKVLGGVSIAEDLAIQQFINVVKAAKASGAPAGAKGVATYDGNNLSITDSGGSHVYPLKGVISPTVGSVLKQLLEDIPGVKSIENAVDFLTSADTWIRIGEVIVGVVLISVGVKAALGGSLDSTGRKASGAARWAYNSSNGPFLGK